MSSNIAFEISISNCRIQAWVLNFVSTYSHYSWVSGGYREAFIVQMIKKPEPSIWYSTSNRAMDLYSLMSLPIDITIRTISIKLLLCHNAQQHSETKDNYRNGIYHEFYGLRWTLKWWDNIKTSGLVGIK